MATASGLSAATLLTNLLNSGDHILSLDDVYLWRYLKEWTLNEVEFENNKNQQQQQQQAGFVCNGNALSY